MLECRSFDSFEVTTLTWSSLKVITIYYVEESVLLGTKQLVDSIRHFIRDPSGVFPYVTFVSVVSFNDVTIPGFCFLLNWFLHIIKRKLHIGSKTWILCSRGKNNISLVRFIASFTREILFLPLEHKIHIFSPPCNILYVCSTLQKVVGKGWKSVGNCLHNKRVNLPQNWFGTPTWLLFRHVKTLYHGYSNSFLCLAAYT